MGLGIASPIELIKRMSMISSLAKRIFGSANDRYVKGLDKIVKTINALESELEKLPDAELAARTNWLKERVAKGETLDDILPDAFATVREAAKRTLGQRHFNVPPLARPVLPPHTTSEP